MSNVENKKVHNDFVKINAAQLHAQVLETLQFNMQEPDPKNHSNLFISGGPGIGKTYTVEEVAKELDLQFFDLRLSSIAPMDMLGLPVIDKEQNRAVFTLPVFFPQEDHGGHKGTLIFLDEVNLAPPSIQAAAMSALGEKRIAGIPFPKNTFIIAAGNRGAKDGAFTFEMSTPLNNRLLHLEMTDDPQAIYKSFVEFAGKTGRMHPLIMGLLGFKPSLIYQPSRDSAAFPTPRSWTNLSRRLTYADSLGQRLDDVVIRGLIGPAAAIELNTFLEIRSKLPEFPRAIHEGYYPKDADKVFQYVYCSTIVGYGAGDKELITPVIDIMSKFAPAEIAVATIRPFAREFFATLSSNTTYRELFHKVVHFTIKP